jgi:hypothetical protein
MTLFTISESRRMYARVHESHPIVREEGSDIFSFQDGVLLACLASSPNSGYWERASSQILNNFLGGFPYRLLGDFVR